MIKMVCKTCGTRCIPVREPPSTGLTILTFCLGILPGVLYLTIRRLFNRPSCTSCGSTELVGEDTPLGRDILTRHQGFF